MREKTQRQKPYLSDEEKDKIIELHKTITMVAIAKQIGKPKQWCYKFADEQGLEIKYCRKNKKPNKHTQNTNPAIFSFSLFGRGETMFLKGIPKSEIDKDLKEEKDEKFLKLFPNFGKKGYDLYYQKSKRIN